MTNPTDFIRANTQLVSPPLVPEIKLHLATEVLPLWRLTEEDLAQQGIPPPYWALAWAGSFASSSARSRSSVSSSSSAVSGR